MGYVFSISPVRHKYGSRAERSRWAPGRRIWNNTRSRRVPRRYLQYLLTRIRRKFARLQHTIAEQAVTEDNPSAVPLWKLTHDFAAQETLTSECDATVARVSRARSPTPSSGLLRKEAQYVFVQQQQLFSSVTYARIHGLDAGR